jgi:hypothetical protein
MPDLALLRQCFPVAARMREWSDADQAEIGAEIRAAIDSGDTEVIAAWQQHLEACSGLAELGALCRAAEARIRADCAAARERQQREAA